ncbi:hypothetical protein EUGRSUZ_L01596 [Eucalyptus grandis]|uniref:Protein kinase domain-containing protein n=1 Tax=Eucalyptus grandis TaxID=71139 RepID=A0A058ZSQ3_EUCGR|nr:hypothetical protein EUGRSUZ_L01596 [Eucalyptus grandis]
MVSLYGLPSFLSFSFVFLSQFSNFIDTQAQDYDYLAATISTQWVNNVIATHVTRHVDGSIVQAILLRGKGGSGPAYACSFYCNATMKLMSEGDLVLKHADGTVAWSTNTSGKSIVGLNMTDLGNLVSFGKDNVAVWQSFDELTDLLVLRKKLRQGQILMPSVSKTTWTINDMISLSMIGDVLRAQVEINHPQIYFEREGSTTNASIEFPYIEFVNGSLSWISYSSFFWFGEDCAYPTVCGRYGICSNGQYDRQPNFGCSKNVPSCCWAPKNQTLLELKNVMYFSFTLDLEDIDALCSKETCTKNCSCKAAIFQYHSNRTSDNYYLPTRVLRALFALMIFITAIVLFVQKRAKEDYLDQVLGVPTRFAYNDLKTITDGFGKKLGEVRKSFLVEVETIDSIHHVNLVRLIKFCTEKFHRLLIYDYISNGSLDRWIFHKFNELKGLNYLHEDCGQKIFHLDIKSPNILLDGNFNAKVADFGLFKLIDKDQSHVITTMIETLGYVALEWWSKAIIEKIGVYSFGMVNLEIVHGRKILGRSLEEEDMHLLSLFKRSDDMQLNGPTAVNMMSIVAWCLQGDYTKRPSTSMVIKVLEGVMEVPRDLDYDFTARASTGGEARFSRMDVEFNDASALLPSILNGPR